MTCPMLGGEPVYYKIDSDAGMVEKSEWFFHPVLNVRVSNSCHFVVLGLDALSIDQLSMIMTFQHLCQGLLV